MPIVPASLDALPIGARVVARYRLERSETETTVGHPTMTDAVGELVARDADTIVVQTRRGSVSVPRHRLVALKEVPPAPARRGPAHLALSVGDLARVSAPAWGALEREPLGDWELRASHGFTQRGNSTLALGDPGLPLTSAVDAVERWYAARSLPPRVCLPGPVGFDPGGDPVGAELLTRGWTVGGRSHQLTAATATIASGRPASVSGQTGPTDPTVEVTDVLRDPWLQAYGRSRAVVDTATAAVLAGSPRQLFGSVVAQDDSPDEDPPIAIARLGVAHGWGGLGAVWTDPAHRGRGLARLLTARLAAAAGADGIRLVHLQVEADNEPALRLYERLGFERHSEYVYLTGPGRS